jgi:hypothetical protein
VPAMRQRQPDARAAARHKNRVACLLHDVVDVRCNGSNPNVSDNDAQLLLSRRSVSTLERRTVAGKCRQKQSACSAG